MMRVETAWSVEWLDADEHPPPKGTKVLLLTRGGVAVMGHWQQGMVAWTPLPRVPQSIKEKML